MTMVVVVGADLVIVVAAVIYARAFVIIEVVVMERIIPVVGDYGKGCFSCRSNYGSYLWKELYFFKHWWLW